MSVVSVSLILNEIFKRSYAHQVINNESFLNKNPNLLYDDNEPSFLFILFFVFLISLYYVFFPHYIS